MTAIITVFIVFAVANLFRCLSFAYRSARDLNDGGYPIYGDAVHHGGFVVFAAVLAGQTSNFYSPYQRGLAWSAILLFVLNVWLIGRFTKAGDRARIRRDIEIAGRNDSPQT